MPQFRQLAFDGVYEITPDRHEDDRGYFTEYYNSRDFLEAGIVIDCVQDNQALSHKPYVLRGLHFQKPPFAQDKLIRIIRGSVLDVIVDIRSGSPTFAKSMAIELSAEKWNQVFIPKGFAHGYLTLEANTECQYKVSAHYSPQHERAIRFDDPEIGIDWQMDHSLISLSDKDLNAGSLSQSAEVFKYGE